MKTLTLVLCLFTSIIFNEAIAQKIKVEEGALVVSKINSIERGNLSPEQGMIIFNVDIGKFQGYAPIIDYNLEDLALDCSSSSLLDLAFNMIKIEPSHTLEAIAIDLKGGTLNTGQIEILDGSPCGGYTQLAFSQNQSYASNGYIRYFLSSEVLLQNGNTYYIRTLSGSVIALFGCIFWPGENSHEITRTTYSDLGPYCTNQDDSPFFRIVNEGWLNLH